jgi:hypothetical protein
MDQNQERGENANTADASDVAAAYRCARNVFQIGSAFMPPQNVAIGTVLFAAAVIGKLRAEAQQDPNSYSGQLLPLLEREIALVTEEAVIGRTNSLKDPTNDSWDPVATFAARGERAFTTPAE